MLSSRAKYALKALVFLAADADNKPTRSRAIAAAINAPIHFIESIMFELKSAGFVNGARGRSGGYRLTQPNDISYAAVIRAIDGPIALVYCASKTAFKACEDCKDFDSCQIRLAMSAARDAAAHVLEGIRIGEIVGSHAHEEAGRARPAVRGREVESDREHRQHDLGQAERSSADHGDQQEPEEEPGTAGTDGGACLYVHRSGH